ncbi:MULTISPECIES: PAS domain S-box protein [Myxococcaceae]|uniref:PAS domain S-box protein n=1 Tax=Myxococcaceae TaxID=31 RepID=UPI00188EF299|nr:PAS domain S-box protein [Simulacricoccus sp. 17bor-14]
MRLALSALLPVLAALGVSVALQVLAPGMSVPFPLFTAAVMAAAWLGGRRAGFVCTALALLALGLRFVLPRGLLLGDALLLGSFALLGGLASVALGSQRAHTLRMQAERRLLDAVLAQAPVGVIAAEAPGGRVVLYNAASEQVLGHPVIPSEAVTQYARYGGLTADGTPVDPEAYPTARALRGETVRDERMRYLRGDGSETLLQISAAPVREPGGAITAAVCVFTDVSERERAEAQLRASEERYRQIFEAAPQVIWTNRVDGTDTRFNARWRELTGQTPEVSAGVGWQEAIHPEDRPRLRELRAQGIREERPYAVDFRVRTASGRYHWLLARVVPLKGAEGRLEGWLGAGLDIHERKRTEELQRFLSEASATLARALGEREVLEEAVRLAVPELCDWCVVDLNAPGGLQRAAVFHPDPALAEHVETLRRHGPRAGSASPVLEVFRTGRAQLLQPYPEAQLRTHVQNDAHHAAVRALSPESMLVVPLLARERVLGTFVLTRSAGREPYTPEDVALAEDFGRRCGLALDNARLLTELQRSLRTRDDFLSSVAHDLRNPLSVVALRAGMLRAEVERGGIAPERITAAAARIGAASDEMAAMVESLVDLVRSEMGAPPTLRLSLVDLASLARDVAQDLQQQEARTHRLQLSMPATAVKAAVDEVRVRRVLRNLVTNAVKYSPEGREISVRVQERAREGKAGALIEVRDEGMGIPAGDLPHLFGRFFRGENVVGRIPGTGIGLFGARQIVEQHGGSIEVKSVEGEGSTFSVWLPLAAPEAAPTSP